MALTSVLQHIGVGRLQSERTSEEEVDDLVHDGLVVVSEDHVLKKDGQEIAFVLLNTLLAEIRPSLVHDVLAEFSDLLNVLGVFLILLTRIEEHKIGYNGKDLPAISEYHE